jgi:hypothetical protein
MSYFFTGDLITSNSSGIGYSAGDSGHETIIRGPVNGNENGTVVLHLPASTGTSGQVLQTDGSGVLSFVNASGSPAGSDTQLQYNNGGSFGAVTGFTYNDQTDNLFLSSDLFVNTGNSSIVATADSANALAIVSDGGTSSTLKILNDHGTDEAAIAITAASGGIDMDAAADKDVNIAGGQVFLVSKENTTSAISLTTNIGASETIVMTNTLGTDSAAIGLTATAGGITLAPGTSITTSKGFITTPYQLNVLDTGALDPHQLITTNNNAVLLNLTDASNSNTATITLGGSSVAGQNMHLFFDKTGLCSLRLDFGENTLTSGSGLARYLTFSNTGQSASLMYVGDKWRIINTGAAVS